MSRPHPASLPRAFHRAVALLGVALVLLLGAAGVSTELHAVLHGHTHSVGQDDGHAHGHHGHAHDDHHHHPHHGHAPASADHADHATHEDEACVVNLFSQGVACVVEQPQVSAAAELGESLFQTVAEQATPTKPAGLWPPPCGPPLK